MLCGKITVTSAAESENRKAAFLSVRQSERKHEEPGRGISVGSVLKQRHNRATYLVGTSSTRLVVGLVGRVGGHLVLVLALIANLIGSRNTHIPLVGRILYARSRDKKNNLLHWHDF